MSLLVNTPLGLIETVLSDQLRALTLLRQVEAALTVEPLPHLAGAFPGGGPGGVSLTRLVPARLFEDEPDVPDPEHYVYKPKDLRRDGKMDRSEWVCACVGCSRMKDPPQMSSDETSEAPGSLHICSLELCRLR